MDRQGVTLRLKEQKRLHVLSQIGACDITVEKGAELLGMTERHLYLFNATYREQGPQVLTYGKRHAASSRCILEGLKNPF
jgi:hypothetical protein